MADLPLSYLKVVEFAGLAPGPFAGLVLADWGASVTRIDRPDQKSLVEDVLCRGKRSLAINPKVPSGLDALRKLIARADVLIDPFRPGVMERLGLGPDVFLGHGGINQRLVYARLVGFSRTGPHKNMAGHDINYLAISGVLSMLPGAQDRPTFPLNLLADFAGGGMTCALGILLALIERTKSGRGQVVSTDMVSGTQYVSSFPLILSLFPQSPFSGERMTNTLNGGAPFYDIYTCSDGRWMSVGCLEPQFYKVFLQKFKEGLQAGLTGEDGWTPEPGDQQDRSHWLRLRDYLMKGFKTNTRDYWAQIFHGTDACAIPVLSPDEAASLSISESPIPAPHPDLGRTAPALSDTAQFSDNLLLRPGAHTEEVLEELGLSMEERRKLAQDGALGKNAKEEASVRPKL